MQGPHIRLAQLLNPGERAPGKRPPAEPGINLLGGDRRGRQRHIHPNRPRGTHGVRRVPDEQQPVPRPVTDEQDDRRQGKEWREVVER